MEITTVGLDIAKRVFKFTEPMRRAKASYAANCSEQRC